MFRRVAWGLLVGLVLLACGLVAVWAWSFRWLGTARKQFEARQLRGAEQTLLQFLRWHPRHSEAHYLLGATYGQLNKWELSLEHFQRVPADSPQAKEALWRTGDVAMMLNRAADTEQALLRSLELNPESLEARRGLIALYRWQDREMDAEPLVWEAYELTPVAERPFLMAEWFRFRYAQRSTGDTFQRLTAFLGAQPDDAQTAIALGLWSVRQRQLGPARALLEKVFLHSPNDISARAAWATCLLELGSFQQLETVLDDWPDSQRDLRYWRIRGIWLQEFAGRYDEALDCLERWLQKYPDDWQTHYRAVTCLRVLGRPQDAEARMALAENLKEAIRYERVDEILSVTLKNLYRPEHRHRMGDFYRAVGLVREATVWYEMALELDRQFEPSRRALHAIRNETTATIGGSTRVGPGS